MRLKFQVFTKGGPEFEVPIKDGMTIGRSDCDVSLKDKRVSSRHAHVEIRDGEWVLADDDSYNGLIVGGQRLTTVPLKPGLEIFVGSARLVVQDDEDQKSLSLEAILGDGPSDMTSSIVVPKGWGDDDDESSGSDGARDLLGFAPPTDPEEEPEEPVKTPPPAPAEPVTWRTRLQKALRETEAENKIDVAKNLFRRPVRLNFVGGPMYDTSLDLIFGPRAVGPCGDIGLYDSFDSPVYFVLAPREDGARLTSGDGVEVRINGDPKTSHTLVDGDEICVGTTTIKVEFLDAI